MLGSQEGARGASGRPVPADDARAGLLLVDAEPAIQAAVQAALRSSGHPIFVAATASEAVALLERESVAGVLSGPGIAEVTAVMRARFPQIQRIVMSPHPDQLAAQEAGVFRFLSTPWDPDLVARTVEGAFDQYRILRDNERLWQLTERQNTELRSLNRDLEERIRRRTGQLVRAKLEWEGTFDAIVDPVAIIDGDFRVVRANVAFGRGAGVDVRHVPGQRCHVVLAGRETPCVGCPLRAALSGLQPRSVDIAATHGRTLEVSAYPLDEAARVDESDQGDTPSRRAVCYYRDVTDARTLQTELERTRRLASLGLFVGGVAHEINNPLGAILAFTQILLRKPSNEPDLTETLEEIQTAALRTKRIIGSLISFAQGSELRHTDVMLGEVVMEAVAAFRRDYGASLEIDTRIAEGVPVMQGDPTLLHQLLRNLLQNAEHATQGKSGKVTVTVEAGAGGTAVAEVTDDGIGISETQIGRVFDPFFTTKLDGRGTGLGLSICHRIVEQHRGNIEVRSKVGVGTTFRVIFPGRTGEKDQ